MAPASQLDGKKMLAKFSILTQEYKGVGKEKERKAVEVPFCSVTYLID